MMHFTAKPEARIAPTEMIFRMIATACRAFTETMGAAWVTVVTSGHDSVHMIGSKHDSDEGLDFRTGHSWRPPLMSEAQAKTIRDRLKILLGPDYDVVLEKDHIHAEYDPKPVTHHSSPITHHMAS